MPLTKFKSKGARDVEGHWTNMRIAGLPPPTGIEKSLTQAGPCSSEKNIHVYHRFAILILDRP